jgi:hypothetical protein
MLSLQSCCSDECEARHVGKLPVTAKDSSARLVGDIVGLKSDVSRQAILNLAFACETIPTYRIPQVAMAL